MNHRELLRKYIRHVMDYEGVDFIDQIGYHPSEVVFTPEEEKELNLLRLLEDECEEGKCSHCGAAIDGKGKYFQSAEDNKKPPMPPGTYDMYEQSRVSCEHYGVPMPDKVRKELVRRGTLKKRDGPSSDEDNKPDQ